MEENEIIIRLEFLRKEEGKKGTIRTVSRGIVLQKEEEGHVC